jgi:hypothetical protein
MRDARSCACKSCQEYDQLRQSARYGRASEKRARALPREPFQLRARRGDGQRYFCAINFVPVGPMPVI